MLKPCGWEIAHLEVAGGIDCEQQLQQMWRQKAYQQAVSLIYTLQRYKSLLEVNCSGHSQLLTYMCVSSGTTQIELQGRSFRVLQLVGFQEAVLCMPLGPVSLASVINWTQSSGQNSTRFCLVC